MPHVPRHLVATAAQWTLRPAISFLVSDWFLLVVAEQVLYSVCTETMTKQTGICVLIPVTVTVRNYK